MYRIKANKTHEVNPHLTDLYVAACPECGGKAITSSKDSIVTCNGCGKSFGIYI